MKRAFVFSDDKSKKFWWIECDKTELCVNFGKIDTTGRYQIKEFDDEAGCLKEAEKLISQKVKKGYKETPEFDFINRFYFDDEECGLHPLTSHPNFREHFIDDLYYNCSDEEAPFGSDEGSDTLADMQDLVRKKGLFDFSLYPQSLIENVWDMKYIVPTEMDEKSVAELLAKDEMNLIQSDMVTYASAFAQIKITGFVHPKLKDDAITAMKRMAVWSKLQGYGESSEIGDIVMKDLLSFNKFQK